LRIFIAAGAVKVGTYRSDGQRIVYEGISEKDLKEFLDTITIPRGLRSREENRTVLFFAHHLASCRMGATAEESADKTIREVVLTRKSHLYLNITIYKHDNYFVVFKNNNI
jgi:hypothetical protein